MRFTHTPMFGQGALPDFGEAVPPLCGVRWRGLGPAVDAGLGGHGIDGGGELLGEFAEFALDCRSTPLQVGRVEGRNLLATLLVGGVDQHEAGALPGSNRPVALYEDEAASREGLNEGCPSLSASRGEFRHHARIRPQRHCG